MGQLAQVFSGRANEICSVYNNILLGVYGLGIIGLILIIVGAVVPSTSKEKRNICSYCNFVASSETELLKHASPSEETMFTSK